MTWHTVARRIDRVVNTALSLVAGVALLALLLHVLANAALRGFFRDPIDGTTEVAGFWYLPAVALLGIALAQQGREHIEARLLFDRMADGHKIVVELFARVLTIALSVLFAYYGLYEAVDAWHLGLTAGTGTVVVWPVMFLVPLAFALYALDNLLDVVAIVMSRDAGADWRGSRDEHASQLPGGIA